ncbi:MAG: CHAT domain-containing protein [Bryobacterales bacterium]|nr:CHAT domain-containing protein [Bryobacterales bacterium]
MGTGRIPVLVLVLLTACCGRREPPDALYLRAERTHRQGRLAEALQLARNGFKSWEKQPGSEWHWKFRLLTAEILMDSGAAPQAQLLLEGEGDPPSPLLQARRRLAEAYALRRLFPGSSRRSADLLDQAASLASASPALMTRVELERALTSADLPGALAHLGRASAWLRSTGDEFLTAWLFLDQAFHRFRHSRFDEALPWLEKARALSERNGFSLLLGRALGNLGWCYYNLGDSPRALGFLSRAESLAARIGDNDTRYRWINNIGNVYLRDGDLERASRHYQEAADLAGRMGNQGWRARMLSNLAEVYENRGDLDAAERHNWQAIEIKHRLNDKRALVHSEWNAARILLARGRLAEAEAAFGDTIRAAREAGEPAVVWKAHADLARLCARTGRPGAAEAEFRRAIETIDGEWDRIYRAEFKITFLANLIRFHQDYVDFLMEQGRAADALDVVASCRARVLSRKLGIAYTSARPVEAFVRASNAVVLAYWLAPRRSFLWVIRRGGVRHFVLPPGAELERMARDYSAALRNGYDPLEQDNPAGARLYEWLLKPARPLIPNGAPVVVVPDGRLNELNFETLVVDGPSRRYWLEEAAVSIAPSPGALAILPKAHPARSLLLIGAPAPADPAYPPLPHSADEVERIAKAFPGAESAVYSGPAASPQVFQRAQPGRFALVHFAAHAAANAESPLDSAIILSSRDGEYKLYAKDVAEVPIRAELVTLSACRSAGSRTYSGEGLLGLTWAFLTAGAENVIAGLWDVDDAAAAALMSRLYEGLAAGQPPSRSLRAAKLELLHSRRFRRPYYWGAFQLFTRAMRP